MAKEVFKRRQMVILFMDYFSKVGGGSERMGGRLDGDSQGTQETKQHEKRTQAGGICAVISGWAKTWHYLLQATQRLAGLTLKNKDVLLFTGGGQATAYEQDYGISMRSFLFRHNGMG
jgi:hypothetical protein